MILKDLVMQVSFDDIEKSIENVFKSYNIKIRPDHHEKWMSVFKTLQEMEPEQDDEMKIRVIPGDVSGYYEEEYLKNHPGTWEFMYSLTATPWKNWLAMEMEEETLKNMTVHDILAECIYEMTWWGYDEETIEANFEKRFTKDK